MSVVRRSLFVVAVVGSTVMGGGFASAAGEASHAVSYAIVETRGIEVRQISGSSDATPIWDVSVEGVGGWLDVRTADLDPYATLEVRSAAGWVPADAAIALDPGPTPLGLRLVPATPGVRGFDQLLTFTSSAA